MFKAFDKYTCDGDTRECEIDGFTLKATIVRDEVADAPDEMDDGFWPSKDKHAAGYVLPENFDVQQAQAERAMDAWHKDEWWYVGIVVKAYKEDVELAHESLWGIDCNYPGSDNSYLTDVANDLASEAVMAARAKIAQLCSKA
jgi:hypothetical protein